MDINQRPRPEASAGHTRPSAAKRKFFHFVKVSSVVLLFSATILVIAMLFSLGYNRPNERRESKLVDTDKYQAVFLTNQQLPYFAKITSMNTDYMVIQDIYYLSVNQQVQPKTGDAKPAQDIQLIKLGCELHGPQDRMVINREQIVFWENLENDGKVADAITRFKAQNPNGLECDAPRQNNNQDN